MADGSSRWAEEAAQVKAEAGGLIGEDAIAAYAIGLRYTIAFSVGLALVIGVLRILLRWHIHYLVIGGYLVIVLLTRFAPVDIIGIAYDSGGVTTSTISVPLVTALGLGLATTVPGRSPLIDGFGLIALASLFPMITVMGYAQLAERGTIARVMANLTAFLKKDKTHEIQTDHGADLGREDGGGLQGREDPGRDREHSD
jgi:hypothetical protein